MPWCPKCRNEYVEGITQCVDCGEELVDELPEEKKPVMVGLFSEEELAKNIARSSKTSVSEEEVPETASKKTGGYYRKNSEKAEENFSSAWVLMGVGVAGFIATILCVLGYIPLHFGNPYLFYGVMFAVFILFFVMGLVSMRNAKRFEKSAEAEDSLQASMESWIKTDVKASSVDKVLEENEEMIGFSSMTEEQKFFPRAEVLKAMLNHQFVNLDPDFVERFIDETAYDLVFGKEEDE